MAQGPEAKVKRKLKKWLNDEFPDSWQYMAPGGRFGRKGTPDMLCCVLGLFVAIEVKAEEGMTATPMQRMALDQIKRANGIAFVLDGFNLVKLEKFKQLVNKRARGNNP